MRDEENTEEGEEKIHGNREKREREREMKRKGEEETD